MIATTSKFANSVRESASRAIKGGQVERAYSSSGIGGTFTEASTLSSETQQYNAAVRGWQFSAIKVIATACANQEIRVGIQRSSKRKKNAESIIHKFYDAPNHIKALSEQIDILNVHRLIDLVEDPNRFAAGLQYSLKWCTVFSLNATEKRSGMSRRIRLATLAMTCTTSRRHGCSRQSATALASR